jgi:hypothetical protein
MIATLTHLLLNLFYGNVSGIRHQLITFYTWQLPGMPSTWYGPYVRFLIVHYPRAMQACVHALHTHRPYASLSRICP